MKKIFIILILFALVGCNNISTSSYISSNSLTSIKTTSNKEIYNLDYNLPYKWENIRRYGQKIYSISNYNNGEFYDVSYYKDSSPIYENIFRYAIRLRSTGLTLQHET